MWGLSNPASTQCHCQLNPWLPGCHDGGRESTELSHPPFSTASGRDACHFHVPLGRTSSGAPISVQGGRGVQRLQTGTCAARRAVSATPGVLVWTTNEGAVCPTVLLPGLRENARRGPDAQQALKKRNLVLIGEVHDSRCVGPLERLAELWGHQVFREGSAAAM